MAMAMETEMEMVTEMVMVVVTVEREMVMATEVEREMAMATGVEREMVMAMEVVKAMEMVEMVENLPPQLLKQRPDLNFGTLHIAVKHTDYSIIANTVLRKMKHCYNVFTMYITIHCVCGAFCYKRAIFLENPAALSYTIWHKIILYLMLTLIELFNVNFPDKIAALQHTYCVMNVDFCRVPLSLLIKSFDTSILQAMSAGDLQHESLA